MITTISIGVGIVSLLTILVILVRKIPALRVIDVKTIQDERTKELKEKIIMDKFERSARNKMRGVSKVTTSAVREASRVGRRAVQKLYAIEQYYQKLNRSVTDGQHAYPQETIYKMVDEANRLIREEEHIPAEKIFIDIISHNPRSVDAYEGLGNMYLAKKEFDQAHETLQFALRLSPNNASVNVSLAEIELQLEKPKAALVYLRKAIAKRSKNPKYLDMYIDSALKAGSLKDARSGLQLLKKVNPENQKITEFESRFNALKEEYITKTSSSQQTSSQE